MAARRQRLAPVLPETEPGVGCNLQPGRRKQRGPPWHRRNRSRKKECSPGRGRHRVLRALHSQSGDVRVWSSVTSGLPVNREQSLSLPTSRLPVTYPFTPGIATSESRVPTRLAGPWVELRTKRESLLQVLDEDPNFSRHPTARRPHCKNWHRAFKRSQKTADSAFSSAPQLRRSHAGAWANPQMFQDTHPHLFHIAGIERLRWGQCASASGPVPKLHGCTERRSTKTTARKR